MIMNERRRTNGKGRTTGETIAGSAPKAVTIPATKKKYYDVLSNNKYNESDVPFYKNAAAVRRRAPWHANGMFRVTLLPRSIRIQESGTRKARTNPYFLVNSTVPFAA